MAIGAIILREEHEIELIRESSLIVAKTHGELSRLVVPGADPKMLDSVAETFIRDHGGVPAFKGYRPAPDMDPFPGTLCISINDVVVHGIPGKLPPLQEGDIVALDCGVVKNGYFGDSAFTYQVGEVSPKKRRLLKVTLESLYKGLEQCIEGNHVGDLSQAIQFHVETHGYSVVREMVGHGVGKNLHEPPEIPNFGRRKSGPLMKEGMVFAVEPMVNMGKARIRTEADGWTIRTKDGLPSAHFEHTVVVRKGKCEILSSFDFIDEKQKVFG